MLSSNSPKILHKYNCAKCNYGCSKKGDFNKHIASKKHNAIYAISNAIPQVITCVCGKGYTHKSSYYRHKKSCKYTPPSSTQCTDNTITYTVEEPAKNDVQGLHTIIIDLLKQNAILQQNQLDMQTTLKELIPKIGNTTTNSHNNHNNTFNIQMFLDNECKNAISIQDFVKSIEINMCHLVAMSKDGYVDSISNVLIQALDKLAVTDRPLHCTDLKRETVYIKDKETWNKSSADTSVMDKVISNIERKHVEEVKHFVDEHPLSQELDTPDHQFYQKAYYNSLGAGEDCDKLNKKIYKKVLPGVKLDQQTV